MSPRIRSAGGNRFGLWIPTPDVSKSGDNTLERQWSGARLVAKEMVGGKRFAWGAAAVLLLLLPILSPVSTGGRQSSQDWPPDAWRRGDVESLSLGELAMLLGGIQPKTPAAQALTKDLARLDQLPPVYAEVARSSLEGLARAAWHQQEALRGLSSQERSLLGQADPAQPASPQLKEALGRIDDSELLRALDALDSSSARILGDLRRHQPPPPGVAQALATHFGSAAPVSSSVPSPATPPQTTALVAALVAQATDVQLTPAEQALLAAQFTQAPSEALAALYAIVQALIPLASGPPAREAEALVALGRAVDAARPTLEAWSAAATAQRLRDATAVPQLRLPDPDASAPSLRLGLSSPRADGSAAPTPLLADALRDLATALGDEDTAQAAATLAAPLDAGLAPAQRDAVARLLAAAAGYVAANRLAAEAQPPAALAQDPGLLQDWAAAIDRRHLPDPASPSGQALLEAAPYLRAQLRAADALDLLLAASEVLPASFADAPQAGPSAPSPQSSAMASPQAPACQEQPGTASILEVPGYVRIQPCSGPDQWRHDDNAILVIDAGGDDTYLGAYGGAPLSLPENGVETLASPVALFFDLGGSDIYDAGNLPCAHGAACADHAPDAFSGVAPVAVFVDWDGEEVAVENRFLAGSRSQGYAGEGNLDGVPQADSVNFLRANANTLALRSYGVLLERVGDNSTLRSTYEAGNQSQGSSVHANDQGVIDPQTEPPRAGVGLLVRLVGSGSDARSSFRAGDYSQGAAWLSGEAAPVAALLNVAGEKAISHDRYQAGAFSQAAAAGPFTKVSSSFGGLVAFADVAGPASQSNDTYLSGAGSRGYLQKPLVFVAQVSHAVFLDALAPPPLDAIRSAEVGLGRLDVSPRTFAGFSDDTYGPLDFVDGWGLNGAFFIDVSGYDDYPASAMQPQGQVGNNASWRLFPSDGITRGNDFGQADDRDRDGFPAWVEDAGTPFPWVEDAETPFPALWDSRDSDRDSSPSPAAPRVLLDLGDGLTQAQDQPYAFVLDVAGDDTYGPHFSATVHLDLGGDDTYLGHVGAAVGATQFLPALPGEPPIPNHALSFLLDVGGNDTYRTAFRGAQGFATGPASGILFDLQGQDHYRALSHAQGTGSVGGLGVLVDLHDSRGAPESNWFWTDEGPSQGSSNAGVGILIATGAHNSFPTDERSDSSGISINNGTNDAPRLMVAPSNSVPSTGAEAGVLYEFRAEVLDPDGDPVAVTWTFDHGTGQQHSYTAPRIEDGAGSASTTYAWLEVPTDGRIEGRGETMTYTVRTEVRDSGGLTESFEEEVVVHNPAPLPNGALRGPSFTPANQKVAYQLPVTPAPDLQDPVSRVAWGDGTTGEFSSTAIDWALADFGGSIALPDFGGPFPAGGLTPGGGNLANAIDGNNATAAVLRVTVGGSDPPIQVIVRFAGVRQVRDVVLNVSVNPIQPMPVRLSVVGLLEGQPPLPIGIVDVVATTPSAVRLEVPGLPDLPDLRGLLLRQLVPAGQESSPALLHLNSVQARGPGASHQWKQGGAYEVNYTVIDAFGGRNGATMLATVSAGDVGVDPLDLSDVGGRGPVRHASLAVGQNYTFKWTSAVSLGSDCAVIDWGDGSQSTCELIKEATLNVSHVWSTPSPPEGHSVSITHYPLGAAAEPGPVLQATVVHAEQAFDLRIASRPGPLGIPTPEEALLFLALDPAGGRTWHEGVAHLAVVDAAGPDRYVGAVAASRPLATLADRSGNPQPLEVAPPRLVVDASGDDDYLSTAGMTQGYGAFSGVALLVDAAGDDLYVANGSAQGAAFRHGVGALVDLGGDDSFNPVRPDDSLVRGGYASNSNAWLQRPSILRAGPHAQPESANLMQGASVEGFGLLVALGGYDSFSAASRAQGYGSHGAADVADYAFPGQGSDCGSPGGSSQDLVTIACMLGMGNVHDPVQERGYYLPGTAAGPGTSPISSGSDDTALLCTVNSQAPVGFCPSGGRPTTATLSGFITNGSRYGPGVGVLLHAGAASYHATDLAQGAADSAGRGMLLSLDGAALLSATTRSQAYSRGGTAATVGLGPLALRLGELGQAAHEDPEQTPEGGATDAFAMAVLAGAGLDTDCSEGCGATVGPQARVVDAGPSALPAPTVVISTESGPVVDRRLVPLQVTVSPETSGFPLEVVVLAFARGFEGAGTCVGPLLAPPTLLLHTLDAALVSSLALDLSATVSEGAPLHPAGCTELLAFARHLASGLPATGWGTGKTSVVVLPPPALTVQGLGKVGLDGLELVRVPAGQPVTVPVLTREPLARQGTGMAVETVFRVRDGSGQNAASATAGSWADLGDSEARRLVTFTVPQEGEYTLCAQARWGGPPGQADECVPIARLVAVSATPTFGTQLPQAWKLHSTLPLEGTVSAFDSTKVESVLLRALVESGQPLKLHNSLLNTTCTGAEKTGFETCAHFQRATSSDSLVAWDALMPRAVGWNGGVIMLQASIVQTGNARSPWSDLGSLFLDGAPPTVRWLKVPDGTPAGKLATNATGVVDLVAAIADPMDPDCTANCPQGSGLDEGVLSLVLLMRGDNTVQIPLARAAALDDDTTLAKPNDGTLLRGFSWDAGSAPEGEYEVLVSAADLAGNVRLYNPGFWLGVDRQAPDVKAERDLVVVLPMQDTPEGPIRQTSVKPGDQLEVRVQAFDLWWLDGASARVLGNNPSTPLTPQSSVERATPLLFTGTLTLPHDVAGESARIEVTVRDRAGNKAIVQEGTSRAFYPDQFQVQDLTAHPRSDALVFDWQTDRLVHANATLLAAGGLPLYAPVSMGPTSASVAFEGLAPGTSYDLVLQLWDDAGWSQTLHLASATAPPPGFSLALDPPSSATLSGDIHIEGVLRLPPPDGRLRLLLQDGTVLGDHPLSFPSATAEHRFSFSWDSLLDAATLQSARDVTFLAEVTDGVDFASGGELRSAQTVRRVDNAPPGLQPRVEGPAPRCDATESQECWYNGTVRVHAGASDDTAPLRIVASADCTSAVAADVVTLATDGSHEVVFHACDGATPSNRNSVQQAFRIDRTLPDLHAAPALAAPVTSNLTVPMSVQASDALSGLDAFRIRTQSWSAWSAQPPANATLANGPDGERWTDLEVRDLAGNVRRASFSVTLDRVAPEIVTARWVGWDESNGTRQPVLYLLARDALGGDGRPAGVDAVRFAPASNETWGTWIPTDGNRNHFVQTTGNLLVQVRDRAGNTAPAVAVPAPPADHADASPPAVPPQLDSAVAVFDLPLVTPATGPAGSQFTFSVVVRLPDGARPDRVWIEWQGQRTEMHGWEPVGDGHRYLANLTLGDTRFFDAPVYRVFAEWGGHEFAAGPYPGPLVTALSHDAKVDEGRAIPGAALAPLAALALAAAAHRGMSRRRL